MTSLIIEAINTKKALVIYYPPGRRIVEPHTLGYGTGGQILLRAFQVSGASASEEHINWKLFRIDRTVQVAFAGYHFRGHRFGYRRGDSVMRGGIIAQL